MNKVHKKPGYFALRLFGRTEICSTKGNRNECRTMVYDGIDQVKKLHFATRNLYLI